MTDMIIIEEATGEIGTEPENRSVETLLTYGIVNIDKVKGPSSHQVSDYVQKILGITKAGHSGTLDPAVTGVQPVAIGRATKVTQFLLKSAKEYICVMHVHKDLEPSVIKEALSKFIGKIQQMPPVKSAVKRQLRTREIYELEVMEIEKRDVLFRVKCEAGTYIRALCNDVGKKIGGAHMACLRRTAAGAFNEDDNLITLDDLRDALYYYKEKQNEKYIRYCIQPVEHALKYIKKAYIFDSAILSMSHGRDLGAPGISKLENFKKGETVAVMTLKGEVVAVGTAEMSAVQISTDRKGLAVKTSKVFFEATKEDLEKLNKENQIARAAAEKEDSEKETTEKENSK
ncbi:RNA-guided pseudouridylation complex pseudouridine synthase subunit Cbf5 [archaeon]|jgi:H/ACA ribonucleoprotein complex subunit 4|nr:RNA-guided pseudouridylation complex pseudouridine synthase subunit Cbf5 [archaeon]MBT6762067.1 RNA-guided pseudouridylation complex pseudouridine synthase subunit Cbf5 [archaeon]